MLDGKYGFLKLAKQSGLTQEEFKETRVRDWKIR